MDPAHYAKYVTGVKFRRALFGYRRADVDQHLQAVRGWFSLSGIDEALRERSNELEAEADRRRADADADAVRIVELARRAAEEITATARRQADALVAEARREAELERRGRSRIGRPVGDGRPVARTDRFARR
jgi:cell division septum initiation protein DivIVA